MHHLSDDQAARLNGGSFRSPWNRNPVHQPRKGIDLFLWNSRLALQAIFTNVNQMNIAVNVALNGGTVINNQTNLLAITNGLR